MSHPNREFIDSLRKLASWLEAHPQPDLYTMNTIFNVFLKTKEEFADAVMGIGTAEKGVSSSTFYLRKAFGGGLFLDINVNRDLICRKVVTKKIEPAEPEHVIPAKPEREVEEETWECPESILAALRPALGEDALEEARRSPGE